MRSKKYLKSKKRRRKWPVMANGMNRVLPGLYIGSFKDSRDYDQLSTYNITHILSVRSNPRRIVWHPHYLHIPATDTEEQNIAKFFCLCNNFIHKARLDDPNNNNVLVHCYAGVSRSATIVAAYLMTVANLSWQEALQVLFNVRDVVQPNFVFQAQLRRFQQFGLRAERRRLFAKFSSRTLITWDHIRTRAILGYDGSEKYENDTTENDVFYDCSTGDD